MMADLSVQIVSDVMCPWCLIGKRRLEQALENVDDLDIAVAWRPFQLDATLPLEGLDRQTYLKNKFGDRAGLFYDHIRETGAAEGIAFDFEAIKLSPNTLNAHRLIHWAEGAGCQDAVVEALFVAYFLNGENTGDQNVLTRIAAAAGMDQKIVADLLDGDADLDRVQQDIATAQQLGVSGVPCFIINNKYAISGAQPAEVLERAFKEIAAEADTKS